MTAHNLTATTTDPLGATDSDTLAVNSTASAPPRTVARSSHLNRMMWGSVLEPGVLGPTFVTDSPVTLGHTFTVEVACRFTGCRIYKAPDATGTSIPVKIWSGTTTGTELGSATIASWTVDAGGWRQVDFTPVDLEPGTTYTVGFHSQDGVYAYTAWQYNGQSTVVWPMVFKDASGSVLINGMAYAYGGTITFPTGRTGSGYHIDVQVAYDDLLPGYSGGTAYWDQFTGTQPGGTRHAFPFGVYYADPPYIQQYYDAGINFLMSAGPNPEYLAAMADIGYAMDWWPQPGPGTGIATQLAIATDEPDHAAQVMGYQLVDEPDMSNPWLSPETLRGWVSDIRSRDSTKPILMQLGKWTVMNQSFAWSPPGASPLFVNQAWREYCDMADVISCDHYVLSDRDDPNATFGVWNYAVQVGRLRELCDDRKPIWIVVESTSQTPAQPTPGDVSKAIWAALIAGARGITLFDHRFADAFVTQDFNAMHANPAMLAMVTALSARLQSLGPALLAPDLGLVTATTSSNTTAGPMGGTYGVPIHYTTRTDGTYEYLFAQAIRPGATTATITIPSWAGLTVTVLDEARTETVSGGGVITDTFAADYQYHLYRRTL